MNKCGTAVFNNSHAEPDNFDVKFTHQQEILVNAATGDVIKQRVKALSDGEKKG